MSALLSLLLNPKNLLIAVLAGAMTVTWMSYDVQKHKALKCAGELAVCQKDVDGYKAEMAEAVSIIEGLKANIASIRKQLENWRRIAAEAEEFGRRILAAAEGKKECEVYHAENARIADDITQYFNGSVRRKINRPAASGDSAAAKVLPQAGTAVAGEAVK